MEEKKVEADSKLVMAKKSSGMGFKVFVCAMLVVSLMVGGTGLALAIVNYLDDTRPVAFNYGSDGNSANFVEGSIAEVASRVMPAVVSIITETRSSASWFSDTSASAGTGMIVTADGYVLTNKHVIDGAKKITVVLSDGVSYEDVELVGTDPLNDVAYLKIKNAEGLPTVVLGDSKTIVMGEQVIAIGNALGQYQNTITAGIISGVGRSLVAATSDYAMVETLSDLIQTDAAINSGNSGGPLVNAAGEVIGINTATSIEGNSIGFAIPISSVKGMLRAIVETGEAKRAYAGVKYIQLTPSVAAEYNLPVTMGAYIKGSNNQSGIVAGGPAERAGLQDGDIITKVNGLKVGEVGSVSSLVGEYVPGEVVQLTILREAEEITVNLTLEAYPE